MKNLRSSILTLAALTFPLAAARAGEAFTNIDPQSPLPGSATVVRGTNVIPGVPGVWPAVPFSVSGPGRLEAVQVHVFGDEIRTIRVRLCDGISGLPGAVIEDLGVFETTDGSFDTSEIVLTATSTTQPLLESGFPYYLVCEPASVDTKCAWVANNQGEKGAAAYFESQGSWSWDPTRDVPTLRVLTTDVANSLSPAGTYDPIASVLVSGSSSTNGHAAQAAPFVAPYDGFLSGVDLALLADPGGSDDVNVAIHDDAFGVPGAMVEDLGPLSGFPGFAGTNDEVASVGSGANTPLVGGDTYWIVCEPASAGTLVHWALNEIGALDRATSNGSGWTASGATQPAMTAHGFIDTAVSYCTAGVSASGCQATLSAEGFPSATLGGGFQVSATDVEGGTMGVFFYGDSRRTQAWGNGSSTLCVRGSIRRAGTLFGTGTNGACDGTFTQDLNLLWSQDPLKNPGAGTMLTVQLWYRDPQNPSGTTTSLSDAMEFTVRP